MLRCCLPFLCLVLGACATLAPPPPPAASPRELAGALSGTTILSGEVLLTGDVVVLPGAELVVTAGTTVRVRRAESTKIDPEQLSPFTELLVHGTLRVEGEAAAPVRFVPELPVPGEVSWGGIIFDRGASGSVRHAHIEQAEHGVLCLAASPDLVGNAIVACRYGIVVQQGTPRLLDNLVEKGEGGIFCWNGAKPYLKGNRIVANEEEGIYVDAGSRPWLDRNLVSGNGIGLALAPRDLPYDPTGISGNREDVRLLEVAP